MSRLPLFGPILFITALLPVPATGQEGFSGVVTYDLRANGQSMTMRYLSRDGKIRQEMEMPGMAGSIFTLIGVTPGRMQVVMPAMGMYMETDMTASAMDAAPVPTDKTPVMKKLGSETIAGYPCDNYVMGEEQAQELVEVCVAKGLGWFMNGSTPKGPMPGAGPMPPNLSAYLSAFKDGMFPLRVTQIKDGKREVILEATGIDRTAPEASLFTLPAGLRKMDMPGMGG